MNDSMETCRKKIQGKWRENVPLAPYTRFKVGGMADVLFYPANVEDLRVFLYHCPKKIPITVLGLGSNILVRDGGIRGVVIRLGGAFAIIKANEHNQTITAGAGANAMLIAQASINEGIGGLEFLSGIPGTLGGCLYMNAGAFGKDMAQVVLNSKAIDRDGKEYTIKGQDMGFGYRHNSVQHLIFTEATLKGYADKPAIIKENIESIKKQRHETQPYDSNTAGSTFKNPEGYKAWQLIEEADCRGMQKGGAMVSPMHANFLINTGNATAEDIESLGEEIQKKVKEKTGIQLHWEVRILGVKK